MDTAAAAVTVVVSAVVAVAGAGAGAGRHCEQGRDTRDYSGYQLLSLGQRNLSPATLNYLSESELHKPHILTATPNASSVALTINNVNIIKYEELLTIIFTLPTVSTVQPYATHCQY